MLTVEEIDEALQHARAVPVEERGAGWKAFVDRLLEDRQRLTHRASVPAFTG